MCADCLTVDTAFTFVSHGAVASILHIEQNDWAGGLRLGLTAPVKKELKYILNNFLVHHLEKHLKAAQYL